jgi:hypothetical protein
LTVDCRWGPFWLDPAWAPCKGTVSTDMSVLCVSSTLCALCRRPRSWGGGAENPPVCCAEGLSRGGPKTPLCAVPKASVVGGRKPPCALSLLTVKRCVRCEALPFLPRHTPRHSGGLCRCLLLRCASPSTAASRPVNSTKRDCEAHVRLEYRWCCWCCWC